MPELLHFSAIKSARTFVLLLLPKVQTMMPRDNLGAVVLD